MPRLPDDDLTPDVEELLESGRPLVPISSNTRTRAVARARASLQGPPAARDPVSRPQPRPWNRWAMAAGIALVSAIAGVAAAYELRVHALRSRTASPPPVLAPSRAPKPPEVAARPVDPPSVEQDPPAPARQPAAGTDLVRQELQLLRRARAAMTERNFAAALVPLAEHARRFKDGRLAEERDALRVKALCGLGRTAEAHRMFGAFEARFPRSPLLPALRQMAGQDL
jgi:hypothetical protein